MAPTLAMWGEKKSLAFWAEEGKQQRSPLSASNGVCCHSERLFAVYWILLSTTAVKERQHWWRTENLDEANPYPTKTHAVHTWADDDARARHLKPFDCLCTRRGTQTHTHTHKRSQNDKHTQIAFRRHLPSCDQEAFRWFPPMNIKYKHPSKFSTPGPYFMPLSWDNKHISFSLPNSAPKMNLSPLYKIICPHYVCGWIIHEGSWRVSGPSQSWKHSWQTPRFYIRSGA